MNHQNVHIPLEETLLMLPNISMTSAFTQRKRGLLYWIIAVWMLAAEDSIGAGFPQNAHFKSKKPNVVIIYADDLGYGDLSCYGATAVQTPRIDALAQNGLMFSDAHAAACITGKSVIPIQKQPDQLERDLCRGQLPIPAHRDHHVHEFVVRLYRQRQPHLPAG